MAHGSSEPLRASRALAWLCRPAPGLVPLVPAGFVYEAWLSVVRAGAGGRSDRDRLADVDCPLFPFFRAARWVVDAGDQQALADRAASLLLVQQRGAAPANRRQVVA